MLHSEDRPQDVKCAFWYWDMGIVYWDWILGIGCWVLGVGYWVLSIGYLEWKVHVCHIDARVGQPA